jgi:hypothetical protein
MRPSYVRPKESGRAIAHHVKRSRTISSFASIDVEDLDVGPLYEDLIVAKYPAVVAHPRGLTANSWVGVGDDPIVMGALIFEREAHVEAKGNPEGDPRLFDGEVGESIVRE